MQQDGLSVCIVGILPDSLFNLHRLFENVT
jgi:hypothetical protein